MPVIEFLFFFFFGKVPVIEFLVNQIDTASFSSFSEGPEILIAPHLSARPYLVMVSTYFVVA